MIFLIATHLIAGALGFACAVIALTPASVRETAETAAADEAYTILPEVK